MPTKAKGKCTATPIWNYPSHFVFSAEAYLDDERFSQTFVVPIEFTPGRTTPLTVGYSDYGHRHPDGPSHDNVVVICGPMFSYRLVHVAKDALAKRHGLRIVHPDRPGMGLTTAVPVDQRVEAWLRTCSMTSITLDYPFSSDQLTSISTRISPRAPRPPPDIPRLIGVPIRRRRLRSLHPPPPPPPPAPVAPVRRHVRSLD